MASNSRNLKTAIRLRHKPRPNIAVDETWAKLALIIREIQHHNAHKISFQESYRLSYLLVVSKHGQMLYNGVRDLVIENLNRLAEETILPAFPSGLEQDLMQQSQEGGRLLEAVHEVWSDHTDCMDRLSDILMYMNRAYVKPANLLEVVDLGHDLFVKHILCPPIKGHVIKAALNLLHIDRDGYVIKRSAVTNCVGTLSKLSVSSDGMTVYKQYLEPEILSQSEAYYKAEASRLLETCDTPEYLRRVQARLTEEESLVHQYLSLQTLTPLQSILKNTLLTPHLQTLIDMPSSGMDAMIDHDKLKDLSRLYHLYSLVPEGVPALRRSLKTSIQRRGMDLDAGSMEGQELGDGDTEDDLDPSAEGKGKAKARPLTSAHGLALALRWVEGVLQLKDKFDGIWETALESNREIESGLHEAFESYINLHPRASEFISLYIDENLKKGLKGKTDAEVGHGIKQLCAYMSHATFEV